MTVLIFIWLTLEIIIFVFIYKRTQRVSFSTYLTIDILIKYEHRFNTQTFKENSLYLRLPIEIPFWKISA